MNREVLRLRDSALTSQKPNGDCASRWICAAQRTHGGVSRPQWPHGHWDRSCTAEFRLRGLVQSSQSLTALVDAGPNREAGRW